MKIVVMGAGAMGSTVGARLAQTGNQVALVDIWQEHVDAINNRGLTVETPEGTKTVQATAVTRVSDLAQDFLPAELVIIFVKGLYTENAIREAAVITGEKTCVLTLQNGVGNADILAKYVPAQRVLMGTTLAAAMLLGPGHVRDTSTDTFTQIMPVRGGVTPQVEEIVGVLNAAGLKTEATPDAERAIWSKLAVNCCTNACCTITRLNCGQVCEAPYGKNLLTGVLKEVCAVANAKGLNIDAQETIRHFFEVYSSSTHYPSMLQDAKKRNQTEVEMITGAVVREGERLGVPVPVNTTIYNLISMISSHYDDQLY